MDNFLNDITSLNWWVSVVLCSMIIESVTTNVKKFLSKFSISSMIAAKHAAEEKEINRRLEVGHLLNNPHEQLIHSGLGTRLLLLSFMMMQCSIFSLAVAVGLINLPKGYRIFCFGLGSVAFLIAYGYLNRAHENHRMLIKARQISKSDSVSKTEPKDDTK